MAGRVSSAVWWQRVIHVANDELADERALDGIAADEHFDALALAVAGVHRAGVGREREHWGRVVHLADHIGRRLAEREQQRCGRSGVASGREAGGERLLPSRFEIGVRVLEGAGEHANAYVRSTEHTSKGSAEHEQVGLAEMWSRYWPSPKASTLPATRIPILIIFGDQDQWWNTDFVGLRLNQDTCALDARDAR